MLTPRPSADPKKHTQESPTTAALKCAYHFMQQRIISNPQDMMGVLLFGTQASKFFEEDEDSRGDLSYPNCYLFTDLDVPSAQEVKELRALVDDDGDSRDILAPAKEQVSMANVLFCANQIFTSRAPNFLSRRLFIITDNDNPHGDDKTLRSAATVRAKDLYDLGVTIELFPISRPEHEFKNSKFYDVSHHNLMTIWQSSYSLHMQRISSTSHHPTIQRRLRIYKRIQRRRQRPGTGSHFSTRFYPVSTQERSRVALISRTCL